jgi:hypothetical protein
VREKTAFEKFYEANLSEKAEPKMTPMGSKTPEKVQIPSNAKKITDFKTE